MVACLVCGLAKRQDSMARHMRSHTTQRVRAKGKFARAWKPKYLKFLRVSHAWLKVSHVVKSVPSVVEDDSRMDYNREFYCFESSERQDLTHDNTH